MVTRSGLRVDLPLPKPEQIEIQDIAYSLSMQCRWNGMTKDFYSVAQHSVLCSMYVTADNAFAALMHDAAEAYVGDLAKPVKELFPEFAMIEDRIMLLIAAKFGFDYPIPDAVKEVDRNMLETERHWLMPDAEWWPKYGTRYGADYMSWSPATAYKLFMDRFNRLHDRPKPKPADYSDPFGFKAAYTKAMNGFAESIEMGIPPK